MTLTPLPLQVSWRALGRRGWSSIWTAPWHDIEDWELIPGYPLKSDIWVIPPEWASGGAFKRLSARSVDFTRGLPAHWTRSDPNAELVLRRMKRIACLMFTRTTRVGKQYKSPPEPSTWVSHADILIKAARTALILGSSEVRESRSSCPDGPAIFKTLSATEISDVKAQNKDFAHAVIARLNGLHADKAFDDWPASDVEVVRYETSAGYRPFNDAFTAALCASALWMVEELGPDLVDCWSEMRMLDFEQVRTATLKRKRKEFLASWSGARLIPGLQYPYRFRLKSHDGQRATSYDSNSWPPSHKSGLRGMIMRLQEAHGILISLAIGPRDGEITDLPRDCLLGIRDGDVLVGQTFKTSSHPNGEVRHWPLPEIVVSAIRQQQKLAEIMEPSGRYLFVRFSKTSSIEDGKRSYLGLTSFAERVLLPDGQKLSNLCEGNVHSHRFRKTVVRLAALSLVGANQILFDILGHRDPEMTLNYILSDPELQDEMREIAREAAVALAAEALRNPQANGGLAAERVNEFAKRLIPKDAVSELDIRDLTRAAEILSQGGRVTLVRKGILCTKTFNQAGPCTKRAGSPDIGNCAADCNHRLEIAAAKADHKRAIEQILELMPPEGHFMRAWWQGQLLAHLTPFEDLRTEMLAKEVVRSALANAADDIIEAIVEPPAQETAALVLRDILQ